MPPLRGSEGPLGGLKVLDFSRLLPGPFLTLLLADLGADVVKVEDPTQGGDYLRNIPPLRGEMSVLFAALNRNKRSVALELKLRSSAERLLQLARSFDVVVESYRPGLMEKLGLGYDALSRANPAVILCSLSGYGQQGPLAHRAGHDIGYLARTGALGMGGPVDGPPALPGVQSADVGGALLGAVSILASLVERNRTGKGKHLDVSLADAGLCFSYPHLAARMVQERSGTPPRRGMELLNGGAPCYGIYRTQDGRALAVGALEPKFWTAFCAAALCPDLADKAYDQGESARPTRERVTSIIASKTQAEWEQIFASADACTEPVREGDEALDDPWLRERHLLRTSTNGTSELLTPLGRVDQPWRPAPQLGEHTDEVFGEAGI